MAARSEASVLVIFDAAGVIQKFRNPVVRELALAYGCDRIGHPGLVCLQAGQKVRYIGPTGPVQFDEFGDVAVPFVGKQFRNGEYEDAMQISLETVREIKAQVTAGN